ncbi:Essential recombination function protein [uncultured Caudovirales phage]|uniref:Essential recombination function protein n=1 Tax=uncultured Caudovirales phage TaxID=2100421 RepID=A0A6J5MSM3_9CAUD|nr:Essential recombination function protein [uncultured Caudovirales phage]
MKNIASALVKAQLEMIAPKKGSVNPFFKNKYADLNDVLAAVVPALNNNGIVLLQPLVNIEGKNFVKTVLMHESGEVFESLAEIFCKNTNDAQAYGSGVTYARRYSLSSICGIGSEDDDAQKAVQAKPIATAEILAKAKASGATMAQIKTKYSVTAEQEKNY